MLALQFSVANPDLWSLDQPNLYTVRTMVQSESQRIGELVGEFLQLSRHRTPQRQPLDAVLPLRQALESQLTDRDDIQVVDRAAGNIYVIDADLGLLRQAWGNIVHNALQAMGESRGVLTITAGVERG